MEDVIFVGNGINRLEKHDFSWENVSLELARFVQGTAEPIKLEGKPFQLFYEEIYLTGRARGLFDGEEVLKEKTIELIGKIQPSAVHARLFNCPAAAILTSNFDYTLEKSVSDAEMKPRTLERRYSLFRTHEVHSRSIWHIHGELNRGDSIMLGYAHYVDYLAVIQNYFSKRGQTGPVDGIESLESRVMRRHTEIYSWVDHFFFNNISVLGMGLDYTELHIWWLINKRARLIQDGFPIKNRIGYLTPDFGDRRDLGAQRAKLELLEANGVKIEKISCEPGRYDLFYEAALDRLGG